MTVTTESDKEFYADPISRADISDAIALAGETGQTSTPWKLVSGWTPVTLDELREARKLGLELKGSIVEV